MCEKVTRNLENQILIFSDIVSLLWNAGTRACAGKRVKGRERRARDGKGGCTCLQELRRREAIASGDRYIPLLLTDGLFCLRRERKRKIQEKEMMRRCNRFPDIFSFFLPSFLLLLSITKAAATPTAAAC